MNKKLSILVLVFILFLLQCTFEEPVLPRWTTPFLVPLISEKIEFAEKLANDSSIVIRGDSIFLEIEGEFEPDTLTTDELTIDPIDTTSNFTLEKIELPTLGPLTTGDINIVDLLPGIGGSVGQSVPVPEQTISSSATISDKSDLVAMKVNSGTLELTVYNNLPFTIASANPGANSIDISIFDSTDTFIANLTFTDTLAPGDVESATTPLGNGDGWISVPLRLDFQFHILADTVFVTQDSLDSWSFKIDLLFRDLEVDEITGKVSSQTFNDTIRISTEDENQLKEALINSGSIHIEFLNQLNLGAHISYTLLDLVDASSGVPFQNEDSIQSNETWADDIILDGLRIINSLNPGEFIDSLTVIAQAETDSGFVTVRASDEISVSLQSSEISFSYVKGILEQDTLEFDPVTENDIVDYNGFTGGFEIEGAQLLVELQNDINIENIFLNGRITGFHKNDQAQITDSAVVVINDEIIVMGYNRILLEGPEVNNLLNILPTDIQASGFVVYSGMAEVSTGDVISGNYLFSTPLRVQIVDPEPIKIDPDTLDDVDEDFQDSAGRDIKSIRIHADILNHSPLGGEVQLFVSADFTRDDLYDTTAYFNPDSEFIKTFNVSPGQVDPLTGFVSQPIESQTTLELNTQELNVFKNDRLQVGVLLNLEETNGFVVLRGSDFLQFSGRLEFEVLFKED
jgi:hypothetical protein